MAGWVAELRFLDIAKPLRLFAFASFAFAHFLLVSFLPANNRRLNALNSTVREVCCRQKGLMKIVKWTISQRTIWIAVDEHKCLPASKSLIQVIPLTVKCRTAFMRPATIASNIKETNSATIWPNKLPPSAIAQRSGSANLMLSGQNSPQ